MTRTRSKATPIPVTQVFLRVAGAFLGVVAVLVAIHYPYAVDSLREDPEADRKLIQNFYGSVYKAEEGKAGGRYQELERKSAEDGVKRVLEGYVEQYGLKDRRALEVGAGSGLLQDLVANYTGLDLAADAKRFFRKPFVAASATAMPFPENEFGALWSIYTLEHIPHPEMALNEMRRVVKPGGILILAPAWNCSEFAGRGYRVRPFGDFDTAGKLMKMWAHVASTGYVQTLHRFPIRMMRAAEVKLSGKPSRLRFRQLQANFGSYWEPDTDAFVSVDTYEAYLWFTSRGDECLNCADLMNSPDQPLVIRVKKNKDQPALSSKAKLIF